MDMVTYLAEIEHGAGPVLETVWREHTRHRELVEAIAKLEKATEDGYRRAEAIASDPDLPDDEGLATLMHWETYFGPDKERHGAEQERQALASNVALHVFSVGALSATLLQYAKQGISLVHGDLHSAPLGRMVGSQGLRDVVWQARNQGLHWEDGAFTKPVGMCFAKLKADIDAKFGDYLVRNLAFEVVEFLGWTTWTRFRDDLQTLA